MSTGDTGNYAGTLKACWERAVALGQTGRAERLKAMYVKECERMEANRPKDGLR